MKTKMKSTLFLSACVAASLIGIPAYSQSTDPVVDGDTIFVPSKPIIPVVPNVPSFNQPKYTEISGSDIEFFNPATREIGFTQNVNLDELKVRTGLFFTLEPLGDSVRISSEIANYVYNHLTLVVKGSKSYLSDGYPAVENLLNKEEVQKIRDKNAQSQKPAWDRFISYLTDAGKIETDDLIAWRSATTTEVIEGLTDLVWYFNVYVNDGWLVVGLTQEAYVSIYSVSGAELFRTDAPIPANTDTRVVELNSIHAPSGSVLIVKGSSGWSRKIVI
ncbi:MAG: hypothetical protein LBE71_01560 [Dysgonamonadaceae bacterium]|jgi:hypothetical protein|nr:hypothetical protein [Dysgonamonadaceae bacterium]